MNRAQGKAQRLAGKQVWLGWLLLTPLVLLGGCRREPPSLEGQVTRGGQPSPGVRVLLHGSSDLEQRTDSQGRYRFAGLAPGSYLLTSAVERASPPAVVAQVVVSGATQAPPLAFAESGPDRVALVGLTGTGELGGQATTLDRQPVRVAVVGGGQQEAIFPAGAPFRFEGLAAGFYQVRLRSGPAEEHLSWVLVWSGGPARMLQWEGEGTGAAARLVPLPVVALGRCRLLVERALPPLQVSPDARRAALTRDGAIQLVAATGGEPVRVTGVSQWGGVYQFSPDGQSLLVGDNPEFVSRQTYVNLRQYPLDGRPPTLLASKVWLRGGSWGPLPHTPWPVDGPTRGVVAVVEGAEQILLAGQAPPAAPPPAPAPVPAATSLTSPDGKWRLSLESLEYRTDYYGEIPAAQVGELVLTSVATGQRRSLGHQVPPHGFLFTSDSQRVVLVRDWAFGVTGTLAQAPVDSGLVTELARQVYFDSRTPRLVLASPELAVVLRLEGDHPISQRELMAVASNPLGGGRLGARQEGELLAVPLDGSGPTRLALKVPRTSWRLGPGHQSVVFSQVQEYGRSLSFASLPRGPARVLGGDFDELLPTRPHSALAPSPLSPDGQVLLVRTGHRDGQSQHLQALHLDTGQLSPLLTGVTHYSFAGPGQVLALRAGGEQPELAGLYLCQLP